MDDMEKMDTVTASESEAACSPEQSAHEPNWRFVGGEEQRMLEMQRSMLTSLFNE